VLVCIGVNGVHVLATTAYRTAKSSLLSAAPVTSVTVATWPGSLASASARPSHVCSVAADETATLCRLAVMGLSINSIGWTRSTMTSVIQTYRQSVIPIRCNYKKLRCRRATLRVTEYFAKSLEARSLNAIRNDTVEYGVC